MKKALIHALLYSGCWFLLSILWNVIITSSDNWLGFSIGYSITIFIVAFYSYWSGSKQE